MFGIVILFLILIILLMISSKRAESIIAKQHEINLELTAAAATAEAENRDKSQFLANISHELRTPLNAIIGFSEIIKVDANSGLSPQYREYIGDIHGSGVHLLSLINDILDFSKAEAGRLEMNIAELDMVKLVKNSMRFVMPRAEEGKITLVEDLPSEHFILESDAKKVKQVLLNLLSNAVKFTPPGGQVKVSTWHTELDNAVWIKVQDTGIGIAPKNISRVMTPFGQVDSTLARKYEGTGLGLPLSKKFVEILGGRFSLESQEGVGTTVTIMLPKTFKKN
jgi:two-component system cell cycle sensor histidine kinase PleC